MSDPRPARDPQRGNSLLLALIVMSSLATLGSLTVVSVQSSLKASTNDRSQAIATYAAESGGAATMEFLRANFSTTGWTTYVLPDGVPRPLVELPSHNKPPGDPANLLSPDLNAFYSVELINNQSDPGYKTLPGPPGDTDSVVIIRSTGRGPQGSIAIVEWEVQRVPFDPPPAAQPPFPPPLPPPPPLPVPAVWPAPSAPFTVLPPTGQALHIRYWRLVL